MKSVVLSFAFISVVSTASFSSVPDPETSQVFVSGEGGYHTYRIPSMVVSNQGTLLAFCEGRKNTDSDRGDIDLLLRRSFDNGRTWQPVQTIWDDGEHTCGNPAAVVDEETGTIWLLMTWNSKNLQREADVKAGFGENSRKVFVTHSKDDGASWAPAKEITSAVKQKNWNWYATGPGAGIQLKKGLNKGRLVIPCDHKYDVGEERYYKSHIIYSDDHGSTWKLGGAAPEEGVNECEVVELTDGRLMLNMRNSNPAVDYRQVCYSDDGGNSWYGQQVDENLIEPRCQASIRRYRWPTDEKSGVILFSNPPSASHRWQLKVRASYDDGQSWPDARILYDGAAAYSCLQPLNNDLLGCLYEIDDAGAIAFSTFALDWLQANQSRTQQPNIVLIVADDLGYGDLACYGNQHHDTPNIDALATSGLRFTNYYSAGPTCTPTRASLMTGFYPQRLGAQFQAPLHGERDRQTGLPHDLTTIAEVLQESGYATACFGKWHLGYEPPNLPPTHGFDEFRGLASGDGDHHTHINRWGRKDWWQNNQIDIDSGYTAELLTAYSLEFIRQHREEPFFLYLPHLAIHFPWQGPNDPPHRKAGNNYEKDKFGIIPNPKNVAPHVKAMVESLDQSVGKILEELRRENLDKKTLVIFTSDNGGYTHYGDHYQNISSNDPLGGQKTTLYEGGIRVPMIIHWSDRINPGISNEMVHTVDLFPTLAALAGADVENLRPDGLNISAVFLDGRELPRRPLYWRTKDQFAMRDLNRKIVGTGDKLELYWIGSDIEETNDVYEKRKDLGQAMLERWKKWSDEVDADANTLNNVLKVEQEK